MPRVAHFDMSVDDPERAMAFYRDVFGWTFEKWKGPFDYWLVMTGDDKQPGINGGIARRQKPSDGIVNFLDVSSVDESLAKVVERGGRVEQAKQAIPGVGYVAVFRDPDGNSFGLIQIDTSVH
jgi:hypothetical protein